ncbi:MAG: hypothetical protein JXB88_08580 [Spirochaetales bacterium]|nr:hypothetical protein [Spirochaetales bacterium]
MIPGNFPRILKIESSSAFSLNDKDIVTISVIKQLTGNKWAVGIDGKVISAFSEKDLIPGQKLKAYVIRQENRILLKCDIPREDNFSDYLIKLGLPNDTLSHTIILALIRSNLSLHPELIVKMRQIIAKLKKKPETLARLLAFIHEKHIDITSGKIESLLELLSYGEDTGNYRQKNNKKRLFKNTKEIVEELKEIVNKTSENSPLQIFNHLKGKNPDWIIIPFNFDTEKKKLSGTIRIFYDFIIQKVKKMTISINQDNNIQLFFYIVEEEHHKLLKIFCNNEEKSIKLTKKIENLRKNLQNTDIIIDDIIYKEENFDGFTPLEDLNMYRKINMYT